MPLPYKLLYRVGVTPWDRSEVPSALVDLVTGENPLTPGRALDLGCGAGLESIYLAGHGWDVVGIDMIPRAIERATQAADAAAGGDGKGRGTPRFLVGDVTKLADYAIGSGFSLVLDLGTLFAVGDKNRGAALQTLRGICAANCALLRFGLTDTENRETIAAAGWTIEWYRNERTSLVKRRNASPAWSLLHPSADAETQT